LPKIAYLVPNLADPAVARRLAMFKLGGAEVEVAGFRRADSPPADLPLARTIELDITHDARMLHRLVATLRAAHSARDWGRSLSRPDAIVARNLEMLAIANRLQALWPEPPTLVYECLDIHRLMLRSDQIGSAMRGVEQRLMGRASLLLTSSPAFLRHHFDAQPALPTLLVENKVFAPDLEAFGVNPALRGQGRPWRIGWFGALRCSKSLDALSGLAAALAGVVEVTLRGRPARTEFVDFDRQAGQAPHLNYVGPYRYPDDLADIYSRVHFTWAIDFFEQGQNSAWLLPNRLYEGCLNGAIPIVLAGTETAAFVERLGIGIVLPDIEPRTLVAIFDALTPERVAVMARAAADLDRGLFRCGAEECRTLVDRLIGRDRSAGALEAAA
jgi:succinoglycan biosynthesis protein ExoL